jgi:homoserine/homoserine lactone efflux protein
MAISVWAAFVGLSFLYCLMPGPSVCFTIAYSIRHGRSRTGLTILGQLSANALYIILAGLGLGGLASGPGGTFQAVKYIGAAYIIYLGIRQLFSRTTPLELGFGPDRTSRLRCWLDGFAVNGLNPQTLVYYASFLPQFLLPQYSRRVQLVFLGLGTLVIVLCVLTFYNLAGEKARQVLMNRDLLRLGNVLVGSLFVVAGLILGFL